MLSERLAVCRLAARAHIPDWAFQGQFCSVTRTADELSIVCDEPLVPEGILAERNWVALKLDGPFPFSMTGVLASFIQPLSDRNIPIFALSTFDTDYVLLKRENLEAARVALDEAGHQILT